MRLFKKIRDAVICPYCNEPAELIDTQEIYGGKSYGLAYICWPCDAYVGVHRGTTKPLGTLANFELRKWRNAAHAAFDPIWEERYKEYRSVDPNYTKSVARRFCYQQLATLMGISPEECHIAMFDVIQCDEVIELCALGLLD